MALCPVTSTPMRHREIFAEYPATLTAVPPPVLSRGTGYRGSGPAAITELVIIRASVLTYACNLSK